MTPFDVQFLTIAERLAQIELRVADIRDRLAELQALNDGTAPPVGQPALQEAMARIRMQDGLARSERLKTLERASYRLLFDSLTAAPNYLAARERWQWWEEAKRNRNRRGVTRHA